MMWFETAAAGVDAAPTPIRAVEDLLRRYNFEKCRSKWSALFRLRKHLATGLPAIAIWARSREFRRGLHSRIEGSTLDRCVLKEVR